MKGQIKTQLYHLWRHWLSPIAFALLFTHFGATAVRVDGVSMLPNLRHGELLAIPKIEGWAYQLGLGQYQRGDIVVFKTPREADYEWKSDYHGLPLPWKYRPYLVKRVVGIGGDRVQVVHGQVRVNGKQVNEPATINYWEKYCHDTTSELANTPEITVPAGQYFVMGDNRSLGGSLDSRMFGPVDRHDIAGKAVASIWPLERPAEAIPSCQISAHPEQQVHFAGKAQFNPRLFSAQEH